MIVSVNGTNLEHVNSVTEASMSKYCSNKKGPSGTFYKNPKHKKLLLGKHHQS